MVCIYNGILLSHKKKEILPFVTMWVHLDSVRQSELIPTTGAPLEETAWMVSGVLCSLKEGPSPPGGSSEPGWPFRTKQGAVRGEAHWMPAALRIGWLPWRPLSGVKSASEEGS